MRLKTQFLLRFPLHFLHFPDFSTCFCGGQRPHPPFPTCPLFSGPSQGAPSDLCLPLPATGMQGTVAQLLAAGADVMALDPRERTALHHAAAAGCGAVCRLLTSAPERTRSLLCRGDKFGYTALHLAATAGRLDATRALLDADADPNARALDRASPLHMCARGGPSAGVCAALLAAGGDCTLADQFGSLPLHTACAATSTVCLRALHKHDPALFRRCLEAEDSDGFTPLHLLCQGILQGTARPDPPPDPPLEAQPRDPCSSSEPVPGRPSAWLSWSACLSLLSGAGAAVDIADADGRTPLAHVCCYAACPAAVPVATALLSLRADVAREAADGRGPLHVAHRERDKGAPFGAALVALLQRHCRDHAPAYAAAFDPAKRGGPARPRAQAPAQRCTVQSTFLRAERKPAPLRYAPSPPSLCAIRERRGRVGGGGAEGGGWSAFLMLLLPLSSTPPPWGMGTRDMGASGCGLRGHHAEGHGRQGAGGGGGRDNAWRSRAPGPHAHGNAARQVVDGLWTEVCGQQKESNDPRNNQHSPNTPTTGLRKRGNNTSRSTGRSGRQKAATRRNMRREERVTVRGPVKEQQPDGMSQRGGGGGHRPGVSRPARRPTWPSRAVLWDRDFFFNFVKDRP